MARTKATARKATGGVAPEKAAPKKAAPEKTAKKKPARTPSPNRAPPAKKAAKMRRGPNVSTKEAAVAAKYAVIVEKWARENDNILTYEDEKAYGDDFTYLEAFTGRLSEILEQYKFLSEKERLNFTKRGKSKESEMQKAMKIMYGNKDTQDPEDYVDVDKDPELQNIILNFVDEATGRGNVGKSVVSKKTTKKVVKKTAKKAAPKKKVAAKKTLPKKKPATVAEDPVPTSIQNVIEIIRPLQQAEWDKDEDSDADEQEGFGDITPDLLKFALDIWGKEGPFVLRLDDVMVDEDVPPLEIGRENENVTWGDILVSFGKLSKILAKRERTHFAGIHWEGRGYTMGAAGSKVKMMVGGGNAKEYRMGWD